MDGSPHALPFAPVGWISAWRRKRSLSARKEKKRQEERLYQERLQRSEQEYIRQTMETYAGKKP